MANKPGLRASPALQLSFIVRQVRRRWRMRQILQGAAISLGVGFALFFFATFGIDQLRFAPGAVLVGRVLVWASAAGLLAWFIVRPLLRRVSDEQVALYLEEHEPSLRNAFVAAVEQARRPGLKSGLDMRLLDVAVNRARRVERGRRVERTPLRRSTGWLSAVGAVVLLVSLFGPAFPGAGSLIWVPWKTAEAANPYAIDVEPGDVLIARGSDQEVRAFPRGFTTQDAEIAVRRGSSMEWIRYQMVPDSEATAFEILLFDVDDNTEYFVRAEGVESAVYRIEVADLPYVQRIDLEYHFPAYTGLDPQTVEDGGDVAVLRGTEVRLDVTPTIPATGARIVIDEQTPGTELTATPDGTFAGTIVVDEEVFYRIEFEGPGGRYVIGSPDYLITPLDDQAPIVSISEPGRDVRLSPIEELYIQVEAADDFGLATVELRYSINGGEEGSVSLHGAARGGTREVSGGHTIFLEEFSLEPGDVVSYYAIARDRTRSTATDAASDIYFVDIRPFDQNYRQADQAGGGNMPAGGGGPQMGGELAEQQRKIVAATFRLMRDEDDYGPTELSENLTTLALLQGRLREQVQALLQQMEQRGVALDPDFEAVYRELPLAVEAMQQAEAALGEHELRGALSPEQRALQHLQRAEAAFRDVQVQRGGPAGGGGGGGGQPGAAAEELADLFQLELDKLRNQYESVRRGEQRATDDAVDEALQKLEELARRQQQLTERAAAQTPGAGGSGEGQQRVAQETEELARQLERLGRTQGRDDLQETARRLQEAADQMRRAQARGRQGGGEAEASTALDRLRDARRALEDEQTAAIERRVDDAIQRADQIARTQAEIEREVGEDPGATDLERSRTLRERKDQLAEDVDRLEDDLSRLSRDARSEQPEAARRLQEAATEIRETRLRDKILFSKGVFGTQSEDYVRNFEAQIRSDADSVRARVAQARDAMQEADPRRLRRQLDEARDLVRGLSSLQDRMQQNLEGEEGQEGGQGQQGAQGEQGSETEGQGQEGGEQGEGGAQGGQQGGRGERGAGGQQGGQPGPRLGQQGEGFSPGGMRQFQRELDARRGDAGRLRDELREQGADVASLDAAIRGLDRLRQMGDFDDPQEIAALQEAILRDLRDFEFSLRRSIGAEIERFFLSGSDEVPEEYRALVDAYYKALSEVGERR